MYGASTALTRKPGALLTGSASLSIWPTKAQARACASPASPCACTTSTSGILAIGLKKWMPTSRSGRARPARRVSSDRLEVLVASRASAFMRGSRDRYSARLASGCSLIASITTSASGTPLAAGSGIRWSKAARARRGSFRRRENSSAARFRAGAMRAMSWSCNVTVMPLSAHQAAMSPPITPAPTTCTRRAAAMPACLPLAFRRSCRRNTRSRLRAVPDEVMRSIRPGACSALPPCFSQISTMAGAAG
ncbi:hypothetical protein D9M68_742550 [compost metagenome]